MDSLAAVIHPALYLHRSDGGEGCPGLAVVGRQTRHALPLEEGGQGDRAELVPNLIGDGIEGGLHLGT